MNAPRSKDPPAAGDADVLDAVMTAWQRTLPGPFDPTRSWAEAGGDSLASLHLLLALEKSLGRKLAFDAIAPDMTADDMERALTSLMARPVAATAQPVFLIPGLFGDEPRLAAFRRAFEGRLRFEVVELPDIDRPAAELSDIRATARLVAAEIERLQPAGNLLVSGFSFGGCVAWEAAQHLREDGRRIAWLGILDAMFQSPNRGHLTFRWPGKLLLRSVGRSDRLRRWMLRAVRRVAPAKVLELRRQWLQSFRKRAIEAWRPAPLPVPVPALVATSQPDDARNLERWAALCPEIRIVRLPGGHTELFQSPSIELLVPEYEDAARKAIAMSASV